MADFEMDLNADGDSLGSSRERGRHKPSVTPTLVIGLGGTGTEAVRLLKRRLVWLWHRHEIEAALDQVPEDTSPDAWRREVWRRHEIEGGPPIIQLLAVDTWPWSNRPGKVYLNQHEYAYIGGYNATTVLENLGNHPEIADWWCWPEGVTTPGQIHSGARQIRAIGRLSFYRRYAEFLAKLEPQLARTSSIKAKQDVEDRGYEVADSRAATRVYILTSLCGGTGAGTWLDVSAKIRAKFSEAAVVTGIFVLPSAFIPELSSDLQKERVRANAYAALKELDRFQSEAFRLWLPGEDPESVSPLFNRLYLIGRQNKAGDSLDSVQDICQLMANQVFLESLTHVGSRAWEYDVNITMERRTRQGRVVAYNFSSFANSSLVVPRQQILEYCELAYAQQLLANGLLSELEPEDENQISADLQATLGRLDDMVEGAGGLEAPGEVDVDSSYTRSALGALEQVQQEVNTAAVRYGLRGAELYVGSLVDAVKTRLDRARRTVHTRQSEIEAEQAEIHRLKTSQPWWDRVPGARLLRVFTGRAARSRRQGIARRERAERRMRAQLDEDIRRREAWNRLHTSLVPLGNEIHGRIRMVEDTLNTSIRPGMRRLFEGQPTADQPPYEMVTLVLRESYIRDELNPRLIENAAARRFAGDVKSLLEDSPMCRVGLQVSQARTAGRSEYPTTLGLDGVEPGDLEALVQSAATEAIRQTVPSEWFDIRRILSTGDAHFLTRLRNMFHRCQPFWRYDLDIGGLSERDLEQVELVGVAETDDEGTWDYLLRDFPEFQVVETDDPTRIEACRIEHGLPIQFLEELDRLRSRYLQFVEEHAGPMQLASRWEPEGGEPLPDLIEREGQPAAASSGASRAEGSESSARPTDEQQDATESGGTEDDPFL